MNPHTAPSLTLISANAPTRAAGLASPHTLRLSNDADVQQVALQDVACIELHFPKFSDGRAFSQAALLRRRHGFKGDIRAVGDVLVDQLTQMARTGFTSAVLRADQDLAHGQQLLSHFSGFYQGDAQQTRPLFSRPGSPA